MALTLRKHLPMMLQAVKPFVSAVDIPRGARWSPEIAAKLSTSQVGIVCLTPSNLTATWILFEAGALAKSVQESRLCTLLLGLEPSDVDPPLGHFQHTRASKDEILSMVQTINSALPSETKLHDDRLFEIFELVWPKLESDIKALPVEAASPGEGPIRQDRDLLNEILTMVRDLARNNAGNVADAYRRKTWLKKDVERAAAEFFNVERIRVDPDESSTPDQEWFRVETSGRSFTLIVPISVKNSERSVRDGWLRAQMQHVANDEISESIIPF